MKKLALFAALLLVASNAYAADDTSTTKQDDPMLKHCRSMMKDGKMMEGMPKQMTDKCKALLKNDEMNGMNMQDMQTDEDHYNSSAKTSQHHSNDMNQKK